MVAAAGQQWACLRKPSRKTAAAAKGPRSVPPCPILVMPYSAPPNRWRCLDWGSDASTRYSHRMNLLAQIVDAIGRIPLAVWSALGTALVSYGTMKVSNGHSARQLDKQLQHDSDQKASERRAALRRDVYLPAAEATVHLNGRMGTLPQLDFTKTDAQLELANFSAAMTKLQLVGEPATAELASAVLSDYGAAFMRCLPKAGQIQLERAHAATQDALYNDAHLRLKRVLAEMTAYNGSCGADPEKFDRLQRSFDFFSKQAQSHADAWQGHQNTGNALQMAYLQDVVATMKTLSAKFLPLLVAVRHELGFGGELAQFQQMLERQTARIEEAVARLPGEMKVLEAVEPAVERAAE